MKINKIIKSTFIALGTSALLIACGGGDNGENTTTKNVNTTFQNPFVWYNMA